MNGLTRFPLSPILSSTFSLLISSPQGGDFPYLLQSSELIPMGLSEPVSGSHVAHATDAAPHYISQPPHRSTVSSLSDLSSSSQVNPPSLSVPPLIPAAPVPSDVVGGPDPIPASCSGGLLLAAPTTSVLPLDLPPSPSHLPNSAPISAPPRHLRPSTSSVPTGAAPPPRQLSYAQAARSSRGPSFVRAHASAVESFAKIPRTGANIICGSKEGIPSFSFVAADLPRVEDIYHNALVMKFSGGRPSLEASHREILSWGMEKQFSIGPLSSRSFLLRFQDGKDLLTVLTRPSSLLITFPYKVFRWHNLCHIADDSCLAPVWVSLPRLPLQCFIPEFLEAVGNKLGKFLCFDRATTTLARPSAARICVELDLRKPPPQFIWVGLFDGFKQPIIYERMPRYCNGCHRLGHVISECSKSCNEAAATQYQDRTIRSQGRTPPARHYAPKVLSAYSSGGIAPMVDTHITNHSEELNHQQQPPDMRASSTATTSSQPATQNCTNQSAEADLGPGRPPNARRNASKRSSSNAHIKPTSASFNTSSTSDHPNSTVPITQPVPPLSIPTTDVELRPSTHFPHPQDSADHQPALNIDSHPPSIHPNNPISSSFAPPSSFPTDKLRHKKVTFDMGKIFPQPNVEANKAFWEAVNRQVSILGQAHLIGSPSEQSHLIYRRDSEPIPATSLPSSSNSKLPAMSYLTSDEESSLAADSPPHEAQNDAFSLNPSSYYSEGEDPGIEDNCFQGHHSDDMSSAKPRNSIGQKSKRNKRHPDQPLKVQLRARKQQLPSF